MTEMLDVEKIEMGQDLVPIEKSMTQEKINAYIDAAEDYNPIHVDPEYAKNTVFKSTIAPGCQFMAYLSELMARDFGEKWITGGVMDLRLIKPVFPKDILFVGAKVVEKKKEDSGSFIKCDVWIKNQDGKNVIVGHTTVNC